MLGVEVVGEEAVVAADGRGLRAAAQRQSGEEERGRPAFEPFGERGRLLAREAARRRAGAASPPRGP